MTISQLNTSLADALKVYLRASKHNDTGKLYNSIKFNCTIDKGIDINLDAMEYIQYLDDGQFLEDFYNSKIVEDILSEFVITTDAELI